MKEDSGEEQNSQITNTDIENSEQEIQAYISGLKIDSGEEQNSKITNTDIENLKKAMNAAIDNFSDRSKQMVY